MIGRTRLCWCWRFGLRACSRHRQWRRTGGIRVTPRGAAWHCVAGDRRYVRSRAIRGRTCVTDRGKIVHDAGLCAVTPRCGPGGTGLSGVTGPRPIGARLCTHGTRPLAHHLRRGLACHQSVGTAMVRCDSPGRLRRDVPAGRGDLLREVLVILAPNRARNPVRLGVRRLVGFGVPLFLCGCPVISENHMKAVGPAGVGILPFNAYLVPSRGHDLPGRTVLHRVARGIGDRERVNHVYLREFFRWDPSSQTLVTASLPVCVLLALSSVNSR